MSLPKREISDEDYNTLISWEHCVPKSNNEFAVSKEYIVFSESNKEGVYVRCTQDCPINIKLKSSYEL